MGKLMPGQDGCVCKRAFAGDGSSKLCQVCMAPILVTPADTRYRACACVHLACACACGAGTCGCPHGSYPAKCLIGICGHLAQRRWLSRLCRALGALENPQKTQTGGRKREGRAAAVAWQPPWTCGLVAPSLRDHGRMSPLSPLPETSCQAKRFKVDAPINSIRWRLSSSEGRAAPAIGAGTVIQDKQGRNCCQRGG